MDFGRVYDLHHYLLNRRYPALRQDIQDKFEYKKSTFQELIRYMRDVLGAPIKNDGQQGYFYDLAEGETFELPGLWFNEKEIIALVLIEQISSNLQPDVVKNILAPVSQRLDMLLQQHKISPNEWKNRLKIVTQWQRDYQPDYFINITQALLARKRIEIQYWKWSSNQTTERLISPQRLVYYRSNWYLDAWCHQKQALRTFSIDAIKQVDNTELAAHEIPPQQLDQQVTAGYGIFAGQAQHTAQLKFTGTVAHRVSTENWHPKQQSQWTQQGDYILMVPYSQPQELIRDILSYGSSVEVLNPQLLRQQVSDELQKMIKKYP